MSDTTISERSHQIRTETQQYGNTRARVADVIDDINATKVSVESLGTELAPIYQEQNVQNAQISDLIDKDAQHDFAIADLQYMDQNLNEQIGAVNITLSAKMDKILFPDNTAAKVVLGDNSTTDIQPLLNNFYNWSGALTDNRTVNTATYNLTFRNNTNTSKVGINVVQTAVSEALDVAGRGKFNGIMFNAITATALPTLLRTTAAGTDLYYTNLSSVERKLMFADYTDYLALWTGLTDTQKTNIRNKFRLSTESFSTGTPRIDVLLLPFIDNTKNFIQYTTLVGLNLFVDNVTPNAFIKVKRIKDVNGTNLPTPETYDVDNFTVMQNFPNNLNFGINWYTKPEGYYQVFVTHNGVTNASSPELIVKAGLTYSQFTGIANWTKAGGGDASVVDTQISSGTQSTVYYSADLVSTTEVNSGFMVSFSVNNQLYNFGASFVTFWRCGLIGNGDSVFYGLQYNGGGGDGQLHGTPLSVRNDTFHIAYYNGVVYVIAESNGKTYQQFNSTYNLYPKRFVFQLGGGGQGSITMQLLGKILLS